VIFSGNRYFSAYKFWSCEQSGYRGQRIIFTDNCMMRAPRSPRYSPTVPQAARFFDFHK
jgi:hypothetical protein